MLVFRDRSRRALTAAVVAALATSLAFGGAALAKGPKAGKGPDKQRTEQVEPRGQGGGQVQVSLKTKGNASHPGGVFRVLAVLKASPEDRPDTVDAVVHFATGDVEVELTQSGGGAAYHAFVPVPDDEPEGVVMIDATAVVAGETLEATGAGKILDRGDDAEPVEEPAEAPLEESPSAAPTCEPSEEPSEEPSDDPSEEPSESPSADPSDSPSEEPSDEPSESPAESPNAEPAADECEGDTEIELTRQIIAAVLEYLQSLFA